MRDVVLIGAEDVRSAANTMRGAADTMSSAASSIDSSLERHRIVMEDWLLRFEAAVEKMPKTTMQLRRERADAMNEPYHG
jgi:hypothetical protein